MLHCVHVEEQNEQVLLESVVTPTIYTDGGALQGHVEQHIFTQRCLFPYT